jgi:hypothetical protein
MSLKILLFVSCLSERQKGTKRSVTMVKSERKEEQQNPKSVDRPVPGIIGRDRKQMIEGQTGSSFDRLITTYR